MNISVNNESAIMRLFKGNDGTEFIKRSDMSMCRMYTLFDNGKREDAPNIKVVPIVKTDEDQSYHVILCQYEKYVFSIICPLTLEESVMSQEKKKCIMISYARKFNSEKKAHNKFLKSLGDILTTVSFSESKYFNHNPMSNVKENKKMNLEEIDLIYSLSRVIKDNITRMEEW